VGWARVWSCTFIPLPSPWARPSLPPAPLHGRAHHAAGSSTWRPHRPTTAGGGRPRSVQDLIEADEYVQSLRRATALPPIEVREVIIRVGDTIFTVPLKAAAAEEAAAAAGGMGSSGPASGSGREETQ
jgi:hypothetical protein